ncbi:hypothetical protein GGR56DRAFT_341375 [Xylariaceae sp. FL0804]|nr:hypothetical protein GGR56DRAFT_341375 [Xylariaceae sp. FL0804]
MEPVPLHRFLFSHALLSRVASRDIPPKKQRRATPLRPPADYASWRGKYIMNQGSPVCAGHPMLAIGGAYIHLLRAMLSGTDRSQTPFVQTCHSSRKSRNLPSDLSGCRPPCNTDSPLRLLPTGFCRSGLDASEGGTGTKYSHSYVRVFPTSSFRPSQPCGHGGTTAARHLADLLPLPCEIYPQDGMGRGWCESTCSSMQQYGMVVWYTTSGPHCTLSARCMHAETTPSH